MFEQVGIITGIIALIGSVGVAVVTATGNHRQSKTEHTTPPYEALASRVAKLEAQVGDLRHRVEQLEDENHELRDYAVLLRAHIEQKLPPPPPDWPARLANSPAVTSLPAQHKKKEEQ